MSEEELTEHEMEKEGVEPAPVNDHLVLISGKSSTGKSASLQFLAMDENGKQYPEEQQQRIIYLCTEAGKKLPFRNKFSSVNITDPYEVFDYFDGIKENPDDFDCIIIDSLTFLMDQFESIHVLRSENKMTAWSDFQQYFKELMQEYVAACPITVIFTAHTADVLNEEEKRMETCVPVKGALAKNGIEAYFSCILSTKRMSGKDLKDYANDLLTWTEEEEALDYKYVFQTKLTKKTLGERIRSPMGMWSMKETYIDNNLGNVIQRLHEYYD